MSAVTALPRAIEQDDGSLGGSGPLVVIMTEKHDKLRPEAPRDSEAAGDRRRRRSGGEPPKIDPHRLGNVGHDDQGNAVWQWRVDVRRRDDDPTIDLLECLDVDGLTLDDEDTAESSEANSFNPYNKDR